MSHPVTLELSDATYAALEQQARASDQSPAELAVTALEQRFGGPGTGNSMPEGQKQAARHRFERHFGAVDLGHPTGVDNESIDADLAREYAERHEAV